MNVMARISCGLRDAKVGGQERSGGHQASSGAEDVDSGELRCGDEMVLV